MKESFGQRFQRLRKAKGYTQEQIAEKVNISYQAVSKWENDKVKKQKNGRKSPVFFVLYASSRLL